METPRDPHGASNMSMLETVSPATSDGQTSTVYQPANMTSPPAVLDRRHRLSIESGARQLRISMASSHDRTVIQHLLSALRCRDLVTSRTTLALLVNYAAIGGVHALLQALLYPFLKIHLNVSESSAAAAETLLTLPWNVKFILAFASDCISVRGQHRRPWLLLSWSVSALLSLITLVLPAEAPYYDASTGAIRGEAPDAQGPYVALFFLLSLCLVAADTASDGLVMAHMQGERSHERGAMLLTAFATRYAAHAGMTFLVALLCNDASYGGSFAWAASINGMMAFALLASLTALGMTWGSLEDNARSNAQRRDRASVHEDGLKQSMDGGPVRAHDRDDDLGLHPVHSQTRTSVDGDDEATRPHGDGAHDEEAHAESEQGHADASLASLFVCTSVRTQLETLWTILQRRIMWQLAVVVVLVRLCTGFYTSVATKVMYEYWLNASPLASQLASALTSLVFAATALLIRERHLATSRRRLVAGAVLLSLVLYALVTVFPIWNVARSAVLVLLVEQGVAAFEAVVYFVLLLSVAEAVACGRALETTTLALFTSLANATLSLAVSVSQSVGTHLDTFDSDWQADTTHVRWLALYALLVWLGVHAATLVALPFLPDQKQQLRELYQRGGSQRRAALAVWAAAGFLVGWALLMTLLACLERTTCLTVAGGEGC